MGNFAREECSHQGGKRGPAGGRPAALLRAWAAAAGCWLMGHCKGAPGWHQQAWQQEAGRPTQVLRCRVCQQAGP